MSAAAAPSAATTLGSSPAGSLRAAWVAARLQLRSQRHPLFLVLAVVQPATFLLLTDFGSRHNRSVDLSKTALGVGLLGLWGATVWSAGSILRGERWEGTLQGIVCRPAGLLPVLLGKSAASTLRSSLFIAATVTIIARAIGAPIHVVEPLPFAAALLAVFISAGTLGLLLSCVFVLTRAAPRLSEALMYPVFILGGMLVPITVLPGWAQPLSRIVSLYWGGELLRETAAGAGTPLRVWLWLTLVTAAYALLALLFFRRVLDRARRQGTLELY